MATPLETILSIRRLTGDTDKNNYRISTQDMFYFLQDAVGAVQVDYNFGYIFTITSSSAEWNKTMYNTPIEFFKFKTLILILESRMQDNLFDGGNVQVGDIKVDVTSILKIRAENLKRLKNDYNIAMKKFRVANASGYTVDTYKVGLIRNTTNEPYVSFETLF